MLYIIWRSCERFGIKPPDVKENWMDNDVWSQASLIAYTQIRGLEEDEISNRPRIT